MIFRRRGRGGRHRGRGRNRKPGGGRHRPEYIAAHRSTVVMADPVPSQPHCNGLYPMGQPWRDVGNELEERLDNDPNARVRVAVRTTRATS